MVNSLVLIFIALVAFSPAVIIPMAHASEGVVRTVAELGYSSAIAVNDRTGMVYVAAGNMLVFSKNANYSRVAIIDFPYGTSIAAIAVNLRTDTIYTANFFGTVSVISGSTNTITNTVSLPVAAAPVSIVVNPQTNIVYIADESLNRVYVMSGSTDTILASIPVAPAPLDLAIDTKTNMVYVAEAASGVVSVISGFTNTVVDAIPIADAPDVIGVNSMTDRVYVGSSGSPDVVSVVSTKTDSILTTIDIVADPSSGIIVDQKTNVIYMMQYSSTNLIAISGKSNTVITSSTLDGIVVSPHLALDSKTDTVYVASDFLLVVQGIRRN